jgi:hypothetical protein
MDLGMARESGDGKDLTGGERGRNMRMHYHIDESMILGWKTFYKRPIQYTIQYNLM